MKPTEQTAKHVIATYVEPARARGEATIQVRVGNVQKELGWINRTPSVFSTLQSQQFQQSAGVELIEKRGGPPSGGPSTTVQFVFRVLGEREREVSTPKPIANVAGLMSLYGIAKGCWDADGGVDAWLKKERDWGPDVWERHAQELAEYKAKSEPR